MSPSRARDPARDAWVDRWGRDADRCRAQAARAREYAAGVAAIAQAVIAGSLELGRRSRKLLRRLELSAATFAEIAIADAAIAELLDACAAYERAPNATARDHPRWSKEARRAGVHFARSDNTGTQ